MAKIISVEYVGSGSFWRYNWTQRTVMALFDNGDIKDVAVFYPDEYWLGEELFLGFTEEEARHNVRNRDIAYLRS